MPLDTQCIEESIEDCGSNGKSMVDISASVLDRMSITLQQISVAN